MHLYKWIGKVQPMLQILRQWKHYFPYCPPPQSLVPVIFLHEVGHCLWFRVTVVGVMRVVSWANILHLVNTATFVASFVGPITRDLIELISSHCLIKEHSLMSRIRWNDLPHTTERDESLLEHQCIHIVALLLLI
jgi:hypothetical protein